MLYNHIDLRFVIHTKSRYLDIKGSIDSWKLP